ncbi:MAG: lipocalin family protein [Bacteroidales bacterium]
MKKCTLFSVGKLGKAPVPTRSVVSSISLAMYLGKWYEIARFNHSFEKNLVGVSANYSLKANGEIEVLNSGYLLNWNGKFKSAKGKAYQPNAQYGGWLKVSFFLCFYADYYLLELDTKNYQYALVGSKSEQYLWILSRTPTISVEIKEKLLQKAKELNYDISKLIWVPQKEESLS